MIPLTLPSEYEIKLEQIAQNENVPKPEIIIKALRLYFETYFQQATPFKLGKDLLGKYGSGKRFLSKDDKKIMPVRGKYKFLSTSSDEFAKRKRQEIELER